MRKFILAGAAALSFAVALPTAPLMAQTVVLTADQQVMYNGWTAENRAMYDAWPAAAKTYYWTLTPDQMTGWWALSDAQRTQVLAMTPEQRAAAWTSIAAQMNSRASANASTTGQMASSGDMTGGQMQWVKREVTQPITVNGDADAKASGNLPICTAMQQDGCINRYEATGKGKRPLKNWPGKPASEMSTSEKAGMSADTSVAGDDMKATTTTKTTVHHKMRRHHK